MDMINEKLSKAEEKRKTQMNNSQTRTTEKRNKLKEKVEKKIEQMESNNKNLRTKVN